MSKIETPVDSIEHNEGESRYVVTFHDGGQGLLEYRRDGSVLTIVHTETPANRRGQGLGGRLMESALTQIRADGFVVTPICSYAASYLSKHPEWASLVT